MGSLIRLVAVLASAVVALSLVLFVIDESSDSSKAQVAHVAGAADGGAAATVLNAPAPSPATERARERAHGSVREAIDDANDVLLTPFAGIVGSGSIWAQRLVPAALALLVYGLGGLLLANFFAAPPSESRDWREVAS